MNVPKHPGPDSGAEYWFPAKRYGWGWGPPVRWQGWLSLVIFVGLVAVGMFLFPPGRSRALPLLIYISVLIMALIGVCWLKGEPPRWRWGSKK